MSLILKRTSAIRLINHVNNKIWLNQSLKRNRLLTVNQFHTTCRLDEIVPFKLSDIGEGIREVSIKEWFIKEGDEIKQFDNVCEVQSDKAAVTITSRYDGVVKKLYFKTDEVALVGQTLIDIETGEDDATTQPTAASSEPSGPSRSEASEHNSTIHDKHEQSGRLKILTTPAVRRIASQHNISLADVKATGKNGRVLKEDVLDFLNLTSDESNVVPPKLGTIKQVNVVADKKVPITGFQKAMVKTMNASLSIPHFVLSDEYNFSKLIKLRNQLKSTAAAEGVKLTFMPFIIKAVSLALLKYPIINSVVDEKCENVIYKAAHNIGLAMDTPNGLVVPNIKNVESKSILEIGKELNRLQELGAKGGLGLNELTGGTFTISNIGNIGGTYTKPVILAPQVCIVAFGRSRATPQFDDSDNVVRADLTAVSWSADHRIIDGATMARFSSTVKGYLEKPELIILY